jgi:hypothetical protein
MCTSHDLKNRQVAKNEPISRPAELHNRESIGIIHGSFRAPISGSFGKLIDNDCGHGQPSDQSYFQAIFLVTAAWKMS